MRDLAARSRTRAGELNDLLTLVSQGRDYFGKARAWHRDMAPWLLPADMSEHIGLPDQDQARRLYAAFYGTSASRVPHIAGWSAAEYVETFKRHMHDPAEALTALAQHRRKLAAA